MAKIYRASGLMSGTSADGIDAAMVETDGAVTAALAQAGHPAIDVIGFHGQSVPHPRRARGGPASFNGVACHYV